MKYVCVCVCVYLFTHKFFKDFIYLLDREKERAQEGRAAGRGRGRSRLNSDVYENYFLFSISCVFLQAISFVFANIQGAYC